MTTTLGFSFGRLFLTKKKPLFNVLELRNNFKILKFNFKLTLFVPPESVLLLLPPN
jgi:hypothetical protein